MYVFLAPLKSTPPLRPLKKCSTRRCALFLLRRRRAWSSSLVFSSAPPAWLLLAGGSLFGGKEKEWGRIFASPNPVQVYPLTAPAEYQGVEVTSILRIRGAGPGRKREGVGRIALPDGFSNGDMWRPFMVLLLVGLREFTTLGQGHEAFPDPDLHYKGERADGASRYNC